MQTQRLNRAILLACAALALLPSGCQVIGDFGQNAAVAMDFFGVYPVPPIPVPPYFSKRVEDHLWERERYDRVPILDPIDGDVTDTFAMDPPSDDQVMRALPSIEGKIPFLSEVQRNNVRIVKELIADYVDEPRVYPLVGPAQMHHAHYKCTVYFDKVSRSNWPIPYTHQDDSIEVVYIDKDHLHRVGQTAVASGR